MNKGVGSIPETLFITNITQIMDNVYHNIVMMNCYKP
jgi:hypothetical protein